LPGLRVLDLSNFLATDRLMSDVGRLRDLEELWISMPSGLDDRLGYLAELPKLRMLHLSSADVTDRGLERLIGLKSLRELRLTGCSDITLQGIQRFQAARPEVKVVY